MKPLDALATLRFNWAEAPDHVWWDSPYHVDGLHTDVAADIDVGIRDAAASDGPSQIGLVLQGQKGVGKTHLLGMVRRRVHQAGGYFFLVDLFSGNPFWKNTADGLRTGFLRVDDSGRPQVASFLQRVCVLSGVATEVTTNILSGQSLSRDEVDAFMTGLRTLDRQLAVECVDVARALVLYGSEDANANKIASDYLDGLEENKKGERRRWGIQTRPKQPLSQVRDITRLLALTGPIVVGVDQLDTLIAEAERAGKRKDEDQLLIQIADGLMRLREVTRRTVTVLACLPNTWDRIKNTTAADTVRDRFRETAKLGRVTDAAVGRALIEKRLGVDFQAMGFTPPYPTWPVAASAFDGAWDEYTARELQRRISAHIEYCLRVGEVSELASFDDGDARAVVPLRPARHTGRFAGFDEEFEELRGKADVPKLLDQRTEGKVLPELLMALLSCYITEVGNDGMEWGRDPGEDGTEVHAWLTRTLDEASDLKEAWAFRAITARDPRAALYRLRKLRSVTGQTPRAGKRHLIVLRHLEWRGEKTKEELEDFAAKGGHRLALTESDVRTCWALQQLLGAGGTELHEWLVDRRPAGTSDLLSAVMPKKVTEEPAAGSGPPDGAITLGEADGEPVRIELSALRKHAAVFAGSGSGKTVLLRRIVEDCALNGVSSIVLDPNNDLARLGDAWPEPPGAWGPGDAALAERYLADTDVVVWTPGRQNGRPLAFQPLPDFSGVLDDEDEFSLAVEVAVATIAPQAGLTGTTRGAKIGRAVLREAVLHHARTGSRSLPGAH